jgi:hypothetical protein
MIHEGSEMVKEDGTIIPVSFTGKISKNRLGHFHQSTERKVSPATISQRENLVISSVRNGRQNHD